MEKMNFGKMFIGLLVGNLVLLDVSRTLGVHRPGYILIGLAFDFFFDVGRDIRAFLFELLLVLVLSVGVGGYRKALV